MYVYFIKTEGITRRTNSAGHLVLLEKPPALTMTSGSPRGLSTSPLLNAAEAQSLHRATSMETLCNHRLLEHLAQLQWALASSFLMKMESLM